MIANQTNPKPAPPSVRLAGTRESLLQISLKKNVDQKPSFL